MMCVGVHLCVRVGEDFNIIQQEIAILADCKHPNIVGYAGSYLRSVNNKQRQQQQQGETFCTMAGG